MQKGLPNRFYTTREDFLLEREMIFSSMWTCIGFASDTAEPGDAFPLEFMEFPLLILQGEDCQLRVFHNVCPHRGHILVSEAGRMKKMLRCPPYEKKEGPGVKKSRARTKILKFCKNVAPYSKILRFQNWTDPTPILKF